MEYAGGSIQSITPGAVGHLDLSSETMLLFAYSGGSLAVPYTAMEFYEYSQEVAHHLGVAPAIAVGLVKNIAAAPLLSSFLPRSDQRFASHHSGNPEADAGQPLRCYELELRKGANQHLSAIRNFTDRASPNTLQVLN